MLSAFHQAARNGEREALVKLLAERVPIDGREREPMEKIPSMLLSEGEEAVLASGFSFCRTALMLAAMAGHDEVVEHLTKTGADIRLKDAAGWTAFMLACRHGHLAAARTLVGAGSDPSQRGPGKQTALHLAAEGGHEALLEWLLDSGLKVDLKDGSGETALLVASSCGHLPIVRALLERGADVNLRSREGRTPLSAVLAATRSRAVSEAVALQGGFISVNWTDAGIFATEPVPEEELAPLVERLLEAGSEVNPETPFPPLVVAAQAGHASVVQRLLNGGADPDARSVLGQTALEVARMFQRSAVVALLESRTTALPLAASLEPDLSRWGPDLPAPDFRDAPAAVRETVEKLARRLGGAEIREADQAPGAFELRVDSSWDWPESLETLQETFLTQGLFLFEPGNVSQAPSRLLVLPTSDRWQALLVMGTNGANCGIGPGYLISWLEGLDRRQPFALLSVGHDLLAGRFLGPVLDPQSLAEEMSELCPDIVEQGTGTVEELAEELAQSGRLFLWWD